MKPSILFAGTPPIAADLLQALLEAGYPICGVFTQPDRPAGRGKALQASPVKQIAQAQQLPLFQPENWRDPAVLETVAALAPDWLVVLAYGVILPKAGLACARYGALNVHTSLLPRYRGAAPVQRAMLNGDTVAGVSLMQIIPKLDAGPVYLQKQTPILPEDTSDSLLARLGQLGISAVLEFLQNPAPYPPCPQDAAQVTYAAKITVEEAELDWHQPAEALARAVRAYQPWPVAYCYIHGARVRIWAAQAEPDYPASVPGRVACFNKQGLWIETGHGALRITSLQWPGKNRMEISAFWNGYQTMVTPGYTVQRGAE